MLRRVRAAVDSAGERPPEYRRERALLDLLKTDNLYDSAPSSVAAFDPSKLKILRKNPNPKLVGDVCPPAVVEVFDNLDERIRKSDAEIEACRLGEAPPEPCWNATLRDDRSERISFIRKLVGLRLVGFRLRLRGRIGVFFAGKKNNHV